MTKDKLSQSLLQELEILQQVLDDVANEDVDLDETLSNLDSIDNIPVLQELLTQSEDPALLAIASSRSQPRPKPVAAANPLADQNTSQSSEDRAAEHRPKTTREVLTALHKHIESHFGRTDLLNSVAATLEEREQQRANEDHSQQHEKAPDIGSLKALDDIVLDQNYDAEGYDDEDFDFGFDLAEDLPESLDLGYSDLDANIAPEQETISNKTFNESASDKVVPAQSDAISAVPESKPTPILRAVPKNTVGDRYSHQRQEQPRTEKGDHEKQLHNLDHWAQQGFDPKPQTEYQQHGQETALHSNTAQHSDTAQHSNTAQQSVTEQHSDTTTQHEEPQVPYKEPTQDKAFVPQPAATPKAPNPFLPQSVIDKLNRERIAAQESAEEAHRTMQRVAEQKEARLAASTHTLSEQQKDQLVNDIVDELMPKVRASLEERIKKLLNTRLPETH